LHVGQGVVAIAWVETSSKDITSVCLIIQVPWLLEVIAQELV
jgi:hypothetical protein